MRAKVNYVKRIEARCAVRDKGHRRKIPWRDSRGIEWSLRALASMRAVRLFLRARAVIKYVLRAVSTIKDLDGEQRALRKFSGQNLNLSLLKRNVK